MPTLTIKNFQDNVLALAYDKKIFLLTPISRTKTIKCEVTVENLQEALAYRNQDNEIAFAFDKELNLVVGLTASDVAKYHTTYLKDKWQRKQQNDRVISTLDLIAS